MNRKLREFAKDSLYYAVGQWISKLGGLILVPILSRIFLPSDYGIIDLLNTSFVFTLMIISLNIDSGIQKYYYLRDGDDRKILLSSTMAFRFLLSGLGAVLVTIFSRELSLLAFHQPSYSTLLCILAAALPFEDMNSQLMLILRLNRKALSFLLYSLSQVFIQPILTYIFVIGMGQGLAGVFAAKLATIALFTAPLLLQQRSHFSWRISFGEALRIMKFSLPGLPAILQQNVMIILPRYILTFYTGLAAVGLYAIADKIANSIEMFKTSFNRAWNPFAFSNAGQPDEKFLYEKVFRFLALGLLVFATLLTFFAREILSLLTPPKYHAAALLVGGLCFYYAVRALAIIFSTALYSVNRVAHTSLMATIQLAVFILSAVFLVPAYNAPGLVLALDLSAAVYLVCYGRTVKKYFTFSLSAGRLSVAVALAIGVGAYVYAISPPLGEAVNPFIFLQKLILLILYAVISYYIILSRSERFSIENRIKSLFL